MNKANDPSPTAIADLILEKYPPDRIANELRNFHWRKANYKQGWKRRIELQETLCAAVDQGSDESISASVFDIHKWGFGPKSPNSKGDAWLKVTLSVVKEFSKASPDIQQQKNSLTALLDQKGIGIGRASKWVCFCDQTRYAIYDSRVSVALRDIADPAGNRIFPIVPRRTKPSGYPSATYIKPPQMVEKYFLYLDTLRIVSERTRLKVAEIEMALFMIGK